MQGSSFEELLSDSLGEDISSTATKDNARYSDINLSKIQWWLVTQGKEEQVRSPLKKGNT